MSIRSHYLALAAIAFGAAPAMAQTMPEQMPGSPQVAPQAQVPVPCAPRTAVMNELKQSFDEQPSGRGIAGDGTVLELLTSPSGSWTLIVSLPNGHSCFATAGEAWEAVKEGDAERQQTGGSRAKRERLISFSPR
jgi:hypothetical protein